MWVVSGSDSGKNDHVDVNLEPKPGDVNFRKKKWVKLSSCFGVCIY